MLGDRNVTVLGSSRERDGAWDRVESIDCVDADRVVVLNRPAESGTRATLRRIDADRIVAVTQDRDGLERALAAGATDAVVARGESAAAAAIERRLSATTDQTEPDESVVATLRAGYGGTLRLTDDWTVTATTGTATALLGTDAEGRHLWRTTETVDGAAAWRLRATLCDGTPRHLPWTVGDRRLAGLAVATGDGLVVGVRDASRNARVETERDRLQNLFATIDDGIYTVDADLRIRSANDAVTTLTGYERSQLVGEHSSVLATEETLTDAARAISRLRTTDRDVALIEGELERADGSRLPIETRFSTTTDESGKPLYVGVFRDVTERRRYEETLEALNRATQSLLAATEEREVWDQLVTTAREALSLPTTAAYRFDEEATVLRPVACCGDCDPPTLGPDSTGWQQFVDGERRLTEQATLTDRDRRTLFLPVADDGMLVIELPPGTDDPKKLTDLLVADGRAALDRLDRESRLSSHEAELATRAAELERVNRFNELVRDLNAALVDATTRAGIEEAVCDRLVATDGIELAWIGTPDEQRTVAGDGSYLETALADPSVPGAEAAETGEPVVVSNAAQRLRDADWAERAVRHGFRAAVSVPLSTHGMDHGVLSLYGSESGLFDEPVWETLAEFGGTIAAAIDHVETRTTLASDAATEVGVRIESDEPPLARLAGAFDAPVELASATPLETGSQLCVRVENTAVSTATGGADADTGGRDATESNGQAGPPDPATVAERLPVVRDARRVGSETLSIRVAGRTVPTTLATHGAATTELRATETTLRATVELPPDAGVRSFLTSVRETYPSATITARQSRSESSRLPAAFYQQAARRLTDRQLDVLRTSHAMGYFAWPRDATGAEIADSLEIAQPTFSNHLRVAQRKLLTLFFDRGAD